MHHPRTRELLGFDATNIDEAKAKRKDLHMKIAQEPPIAATVVNFAVGDFVKILHEFNGSTYQDPEQWRAVDDLELEIGDVVVVEGKATHEEEHIEGWYRGYKVRCSPFAATSDCSANKLAYICRARIQTQPCDYACMCLAIRAGSGARRGEKLSCDPRVLHGFAQRPRS